MTAISFVNELYGDEDDKRRARVKARFINNAMMATLLGAVVSDGARGRRRSSAASAASTISSPRLSRSTDARSIIMLRATRTAQGRTASNIRWNYGHTTIPRHLRDIVVTEYGIADLRGKSDRDVIAAMLAITDCALPGRIAAAGQGRRQDRAAFKCRRRATTRRTRSSAR